jgi:hypothetical protein
MVDICYWFFRFSLCFFCIFILEPLLKFIYFQFNSSIVICYISHFSIWSFFFWFLFFSLALLLKFWWFSILSFNPCLWCFIFLIWSSFFLFFYWFFSFQFKP